MPPKTRSAEEKAKARANILDIARSLFVARGVEAVTMREIAKQLGVSATTLYLHFQDKETLIQELCVTDFQSLAKNLNQILAIVAPVERMIALGRAYAEFALRFPNHYQLMFMTAKPACAYDESKLDPSLDAYRLLTDVVTDVFNAKLFKDEITDPMLVAQTIWAGIHGVCSLQIAMSNDPHIQWCDIEQRITFMQSLMIKGLLK